MTSNILSRLLPPGTGEPSIYETLREQDEESDQSYIEEREGMALDEENLETRFNDHDLDDALANAVESQVVAPKTQDTSRYSQGPLAVNSQRQAHPHLDDLDDEVPQSLLIEDENLARPIPTARQAQALPPPVPGPANRGTRAKWQTTQEQQRLHNDTPNRPEEMRERHRHGHPMSMMDPKERAMWIWANVENLDNFLQDVYDYFVGNGIWCIYLSRLLNLLTLAFVVAFSTFLTSCIDYKLVPKSKKMQEILIPQCTKKMSGFQNFLIWLFAFFWICKVFQYAYDFRRLRQMQNFYQYLLEVSDMDIQTVSWQEVVKRLMMLRDSNPETAAGVKPRHRRFMGSQSKQRMDAHDIANRLMRRDNYLIALVNKDILDLTLPIPFIGRRQLFSKTLEWNLSLCILDFVFDDRGQVRPLFLKEAHRQTLSDSLRRRFLFCGLMNFLCAPFIILFFVLLYFFRYFNEFKSNPSQIGSRQYTPLAEWKFRGFNELYHLFQRRIKMSYPFASRYVDQFPKDKTVQFATFVAFVTGALASILALASVIDPESFLAFEITPERTVLFYLGIFGTIWAVARGMVPEESLVFDPEFALTNVVQYTHYLPNHWQGRLHSHEVRTDFTQLYKMKVIIFLEEIISIILTPFILWSSLPTCSNRIVDFFREFTIHVDGLGYVCSFAVFDFKKGGATTAQVDAGPTQDLREDYYATKDNKMLTSYYNFIDNYGPNQRAGAPFMHSISKQSFHAPPAFHGMMSPTLAAEMPGPATIRSGKVDRPQGLKKSNIVSGVLPTQQYIPRRTPRFPPAASQASPMTSLLLDPQHQAPAGGFRGQRKLGTQSRLRSSQKPLEDPIEDEEENLADTHGHSGGDGSEGGADLSNLGESWKTTRAGTREEDGEEDLEANKHDRGPGVLGLVYQFSKAQTEGRGAGVSI
ncbi:autophagy protein atg9 [Lecanora helva]